MFSVKEGAKNVRVLNAAEYQAAISNGVALGQAERLIVCDSFLVAENTSTNGTRILGRVSELLAEQGAKRVLKG